jgi:predicted nuclease with RNAse H fold/dephospho-CoA kinase
MSAVEPGDGQGRLWSDLPRSVPNGPKPRLATRRSSRVGAPAEFALLTEAPDRVLFLDIETTGLSRHYDYITLVGYEIGGWYRVYVAGDDPTELRTALGSASAVVTFNGKLFDIPFLRQQFPAVSVPDCHLDLRFACRRFGLSGGQKSIERILGLHVRDGVERTDGAAAVVLWHRYLRGDANALKVLVAYNRADVRGMAGILDHLLEQCGGGRDLLVSGVSFVRRYRGALGLAGGTLPVPLPVRLGRTPPRFGELFAATQAASAKIVGIDLTGSESRPSGFAVVEGPHASTRMIATDDELLSATLAASPAIVSIDSPLSLPRGRTSVGDDDPRRREFGIMRACERTLKRRGINVYPCLLPSMQKLTERGMRLAQRLRRLGVPVIESYPGAAQDIMGIPRKGAGEEWLKLGLVEFGMQGAFATDRVRHDELDAITSALVGLFFIAGKFEALGGPEENALIVPRVDGHRCLRSVVVGLSGRICSGKTTAARILERQGFAYVRFSEVIDDEICARGLKPDRSTRQTIGMEIHESFGQRWLCKKVLERVGSAERVVVDGLRWPDDALFFRERFESAFLHVHLEASVEVRERRYLQEGLGGPTLREADQEPVESGIEALGRLATTRIRNESTLQALEHELWSLSAVAGGLEDKCLSRSS